MSFPPTDREPVDTAKLAERFQAHLRRYALIAPRRSVVVAVSGGVDSVVLLFLLWRLAPRWRLQLTAAHFDHRMRPDSGVDADWVRGLCRAWEVPLVHGVAGRVPRSETEARQLRYAFLRQALDESGAEQVATAHHADDQVETVLFRMIRGTGLRGAAGIPARNGRLVRPLLPFSRAEIEAFAAAASLRFREDPTNRSLVPARNRLRHEFLPRLEAVWPGARRGLLRLAADARQAEEGWDWVLERLRAEAVSGQTPDSVELARPVLLSYHPYLQARFLRHVFRRFGCVPDRAGTRAAAEFIRSAASGSRLHVRGGLFLEREFDRIRVRRRDRADEAPASRPLRITSGTPGDGEATIGGRRLVVRWGSADLEDAKHGTGFDRARLRFPLELREWRPGDRIRLVYGTKKLKKLFAERRVGRLARRSTPVLVDAAGAVLWIVGLDRAAGVEPTPDSEHFRIAVRDA